jgi:hypothetical protein
VRMMSESPGSVMEREDTRKYLPQAVPKSTLSAQRYKKVDVNIISFSSHLQDPHTECVYPTPSKLQLIVTRVIFCQVVLCPDKSRMGYQWARASGLVRELTCQVTRLQFDVLEQLKLHGMLMDVFKGPRIREHAIIRHACKFILSAVLVRKFHATTTGMPLPGR